jgi:predicted TIM-barrel fold metal-dependent hydrolase
MHRPRALLLLVLLPLSCTQGTSELRPMIDSHVHLSPDPASVERALAIFDRNGITRFCAKSAGFPPSARFRATVALKEKLGDRFAFFSNINWQDVDDPGFGQREAQRLAAAVRAGARGVKIFKNLGLSTRTADGKLLPIDDPRLEPIWQAAASLDAVVAWHVADPKAFFLDPGPDNPRYFELLFAPGWGFHGRDFPSFDELMQARERVIAAHPQVTFLLIHLATPEDVGAVDRLLSAHPNVFIDTSARIPEFGRQGAETVRAFFSKHQDRILFGSDIVISTAELQLGSLSIWPDDDRDADRFYRAHREYFETSHRQIPHPTPIQGSWRVDGIGLPDVVLDKLYVKNAEKLIWGIGR